MISRATPDPIDRAALRAADSRIPSRWPPRGPVDPNRMSVMLPLAGAGGAGADLVRGTSAGVGAGVVGAPSGCLASVRFFNFSYADSRSTVWS